MLFRDISLNKQKTKVKIWRTILTKVYMGVFLVTEPI